MTIEKIKQRTKLGNSGFSLVELIIVIAIMAILIAVLAPMFIRYVERSRQSTDLDAVGSMLGAMKNAAADPTLTPPAGDILTLTWTTAGAVQVAGGTGYDQEVWNSVGTTVRMRSTAAAMGNVTATYNMVTGEVVVTEHASAGGNTEQQRFNTGLQELDIS